MSQKSQSNRQSNQSDVLPEGPNNDAQDETSDSLPNPNRLSVLEPPSIIHTSRASFQELPSSTHSRRVSIQEPPPIIHIRRVSIQEPPSSTHSRRVSIQEPPSSTHSRRVSIQEPPSSTHSRRVSIQEPPPFIHTRRVSIQEHPPIVQELLPIIHTRRVSIQEPVPIMHTRRVSIQEHPPTVHTRRVSIQEQPPVVQELLPIIHTRRVSIQEPVPIIHTHRVSIQEPSPILHTRRASVQEPSPIDDSLWGSIKEAPSIGNISQKSIQEIPSMSSIHQASTRDTPSVTCDSHLNTQNVPPSFPIRSFIIPRPSAMPHAPLAGIESVADSSQISLEDTLRVNQSQNIKFPNRTSVDVPPSITDSPEPSMASMESIFWTSQEDFENSLYSLQVSKNTPDSDIYSMPPRSPTEASSGRFQEGAKRRYSQLPIGTRLLHEAKKISRQLSLVLSLVGMVIISLITLGQPWVHFQVPLTPPADPLPKSMPIHTIFFVRCPDISCLHEQDRNAYLLDSAWAFFLISSFTSLCLCLILVNITFFTSSNVPLLDFSNIILSNLTGTSMILGVLFYLMQAREYLQEGMTYSLGRSFYLAWAGIFFFLAIGLISYMNYVNFWFILAPQAIWT